MFRPKAGQRFFNTINGDRHIAVNPHRWGMSDFYYSIRHQAIGEPFFYMFIDSKGKIDSSEMYWGDDTDLIEGKFQRDTKASRILFSK